MTPSSGGSTTVLFAAGSAPRRTTSWGRSARSSTSGCAWRSFSPSTGTTARRRTSTSATSTAAPPAAPEGLAEGRVRAAAGYRSLARRVRETAVNSGLPHDQATAALIEAAWALVLGDR